MAYLSPDCSFQTWVFSPQELAQVHILTILQKQGIQNQLAQIAQQKLNVVFNSQDIQRSLQEHAELEGRISALHTLLDLSLESEQLLNQVPIHIQE